ncbi:uncharacterized protein Dsimw501_GD27690, isoform C [Drosophila simulans]|nr:uncharacterized protein LOC27207539 isoform X3 [Drosophila simulans]KMZ05868.1 uncharacterized protein Dsimw501_GD27690, isoform C [Drosophila simulans]
MLHIIIIVALAVVVVIHKEQIVGPKKFLRIVTRKVNFKPQQDQILSAIVITDNSLSKGGTAFLLKGGPPARFAMIAFRSDRNHGLNWRYMPLIYALHVQIQVNFLKNQDEFSGGQTLVWI